MGDLRRVKALFLIAALASCGGPRVSLTAGPRNYVPDDYPFIQQRWTRRASLLSMQDLDDKLTATATFESWDFRWAYVARYAEDFRLNETERTRLLDAELDDARQFHRFFVALYASTPHRYGDLTKPGAPWVVRLVDSQGHEVAPDELQRIAKPSPVERKYFPYASVWRHAFRVKFRRRTAGSEVGIDDEKAAWIALRFSGAEGSETLQWDLDNDAPARVMAAPTPPGARGTSGP